MDRYTERMNLHGVSCRERYVNLLRQNISRKSLSNPSYKDVKLNGLKTQLVINSGTDTYYKEFQSLPGQAIFAGDYIEWKNQVWLVYTADSDDEIYTDGKLRQCQHQIYWQNGDGAITSRFVWTQNASAYNNGESGNNTITLQSNQFMVYIPYDKDTECLCSGIRVHMSKSNKTCKPYELTRLDDISYGYGERGILNIVLTQSQYNEHDDKLVTLDDGSHAWICDYHSPAPLPEPSAPNETTDLSAVISGGSALRCGRAKTWIVVFKDQNGNETTDCDFKWNVVSNFKIAETVDNTNSKIQLRMDDKTFIGESFLLQIIMSINGTDVVAVENKITVAQGL